MFGKKNYTVVGNLIDGLPCPQQTVIIATLVPSGFQITAILGGKEKQSFELAIDKISTIQIMDERQIKQVIEQSKPGMILGAAAFGLIGAMVGGRTKTKEKIDIHNLFVIDYESVEKKQLILDISKDLSNGKRVLGRFRELKPEAAIQKTIEL